MPSSDVSILSSRELNAVSGSRISIDLYGSEVPHAFEIADELTRLLSSFPVLLPPNHSETQLTLELKQKLLCNLRSKPTHSAHIATGDLVKVFLKLRDENRGKLLSSCIALSFYLLAWTVTVPFGNDKTMQAPIKDE